MGNENGVHFIKMTHCDYFCVCGHVNTGHLSNPA